MEIAALLVAAAKAHAAGRLGDASDLCRQVLAVAPDNVQAARLLGVLEVKLGRPDAAIPLLERARRAEPGSGQASLWLSMAYRQVGRPTEATEAAAHAVSLNASDLQGLLQLGLCYVDSRNLAEAEAALRRAAAMAPNVTEVELSLARCLHLQGRTAEAATAVTDVLDRRALPTEALLAIGQSLLSQGYPAGAIQFGRRAVALSPEHAGAHSLLGRALLEAGHAAEAEAPLSKAVSLTGGADVHALAMLGAGLRAIGRTEEASGAFRHAIDLDPRQGYAFFSYAQNRRITETDRPFITQMQSLLQKDDLPPYQRSYLQYALGKSHEDLGEYEAAMSHYDEANRIEYRLKYGGRPFDLTAYASTLQNTARQFSKEFIASRRGVGNPSTLPIFVVGMMRSGTTLVEQVLSSHPEIGAAGEQPFWTDNWRDAIRSEGTDMGRSEIRTLTERYCAILRELAPGKRHVVDKMPNNRAGLGLLHLAFPQARIIHIRRHPVDTCLSIYATPRRSRVEFDHDRGNLVFAYREYLRIMEHWRAALPPDALLEVKYEDLVFAQERMTRRMISWLGLEWNDACLQPERNDRPVATLSVWQVRQPVFTTSVGRWRRFEPWLGEFRDLL